MEKNRSPVPEESLEISIDTAVRVQHPEILTKIALLKQNFSRLILMGGPQQHEWISIYKLFFKLCENLESHMFHEETVFFPELEALERMGGKSPGASMTIPLQQMEEEHRVILSQWKAIDHSIKRGLNAAEDGDLVSGTRSDLEELEQAILGHEQFETRMIYQKARKFI